MSIVSNLKDKLKGGSKKDSETEEKDQEKVHEEHPDHESEEDEDICQFC